MPEVNLKIRNAGDVKTIAESLRATHVEWLAEQIEAQMPKPAIEEPTGDCVAFFSMRHPRQGVGWAADDGKWEDGTGFSLSWERLIGDAKPEDILLYRRVKYPEVGDVEPEYTEDYKAGVSDTLYKIHGRLQLLHAEAITSERKNALEKAIQAVEELAP